MLSIEQKKQNCLFSATVLLSLIIRIIEKGIKKTATKRNDNEQTKNLELHFKPCNILTIVTSLYSIEFDRDCDYFAIAGVTKKIKVFEYGTVIQDAVDIHYPVNEMTCNSKIRCSNALGSHKDASAAMSVMKIHHFSLSLSFLLSIYLSFSLSCISWSSYHKNLLASSDYEGTVILWDGFTGQRSKVYQVHFQPK